MDDGGCVGNAVGDDWGVVYEPAISDDGGCNAMRLVFALAVWTRGKRL